MWGKSRSRCIGAGLSLRERSLAGAAAALIIIAPVAAGAHEHRNHHHQKMTPRPELAQSIRENDPECYCWANGQRFAHGEQACIKGGGMTRLALCDRVLNVMSWSFSPEPCPES